MYNISMKGITLEKLWLLLNKNNERKTEIADSNYGIWSVFGRMEG
jgi:hypothetical protein